MSMSLENFRDWPNVPPALKDRITAPLIPDLYLEKEKAPAKASDEQFTFLVN